MKSYRNYLLLAAFAASVFHCTYMATTTSDIANDSNTDNSNDATEFSRVKKHFNDIGVQLEDSELQEYTASVFIASIPPVCEVYGGDRFMGKSNISTLYFKPGLQKVRFVKGNLESEKEFHFKAGKNPSQMVRLK